VEMEDRTAPVITGALRTIKKESDQNLQLLPGHPSALELQKIMLMSTAHIIRNVLGYFALICCWDLDLTADCHLITKRTEEIK